MADKLVIVESPSKAHTISKFLGKTYKVVASVGHVRDLPKSKLGVDIENDFEPQYINIRGKAPLINELKKEAKQAKQIFLATDPDREGEAIAWHLAYILGIPTDSLCRVTFNEITEKCIKESIKNPRKIDLDITDAQQARRVLDRIVGYQISPLLWKKVKRGLSAGRVQSVAVRLICEREEEIEKFIPEEYWNIYAIFDKKGKLFQGHLTTINNKKIELHSKAEVDEILKDIEKSKYVVTNIKKGTRKKTPAPPFTTSTMQQESARKLGFQLRKTMQVAQGLYEGVKVTGRGTIGLITYMRTDSTRISEEARAVAKSVITAKYGDKYYENRYYRTKSDAQDGHEGIRPTNIDLNPEEIKENLTPDQYKLYRLIYNRFLASQMSEAIYDTVAVNIDSTVSNKTYNFKANGQTLRFKGFMTLYVEDTDDNSNEDREESIPELVENEELKKDRIDTKQSFTEPPARFTEASIVKALEENGIGRPSTYATIISTIVDRRYIKREKKQLVPTDLGKIVNKLLVENFKDIVNVEFTAGIENELDAVAEGKEKWKKVIRDFYTPFSKELSKVDEELEHVELKDELTDIMCKKCGKPMAIKYGRYGKFLACSGYPECKNVKPFVEKAANPCPVCGAEVYVRKTKRGRNYYICSNNHNDETSCKYISWNAPKVGEVWTPSENDDELKTTTKKKTTKKTATKKATTKKKATKKSTKSKRII